VLTYVMPPIREPGHPDRLFSSRILLRELYEPPFQRPRLPNALPKAHRLSPWHHERPRHFCSVPAHRLLANTRPLPDFLQCESDLMKSPVNLRVAVYQASCCPLPLVDYLGTVEVVGLRPRLVSEVGRSRRSRVPILDSGTQISPSLASARAILAPPA